MTADFLDGSIYVSPLSGGQITTTNKLTTLSPALSNLVFGKDGSLYATVGSSSAQIVQIDQTSGAIQRVVASGLVCPTGLAVDPLSGDLFFDDDCTGAGLDDASIHRVIDPANTDAARPTSVVVYATLPHTANGAMAFAPNGTLYAVSGYFGNINAEVDQISPTSSATVSVTPVTGITSDFAVAIGVANPDGSAQSLIVEPAGSLTEVPIGNPGAATVLATGSPGVGVTGPDGCLYSAHYDTIYRLAPASGPCKFKSTSPAPYLTLAAASAAPGLATGDSQVLTAVLHNAAQVSGVPISFTIAGATLQSTLVETDATGTATLTYTSLYSGQDTARASTSVNSSPVFSNTAAYTWAQGAHVTLLSLNPSPQQGSLSQSVTVLASLTDRSSAPPTALAGQAVSFAVGTSACTATTDNAGMASCPLSPSQAGLNTLTATFPGTTQFTPSVTSVAFSVVGAAASAPTVTLTVNPAIVTTGTSATLTWSSTNATTCVASGSWSGSLPVSGTQSVTPQQNGNYSYTLTCNGDGGSATATANLSASLVAVTVTAKSGGGALSLYLLAALALLVLIRVSKIKTRRGISLILGLGFLALGFLAVPSVRAQTAQDVSPDGGFANVYVGVRVGAMPTRLDASTLSGDLASRGDAGFSATTDNSAVGETLYVGDALTKHLAVEFGYTHRDSTAARVTGTVAGAADIESVLANTASIIRGYGNIFSLSARARFDLAPRLMLDARLGGFFWDTKVTAEGNGDSSSLTHQGGGVTGGLGLAYRVWRGLEVGVVVDHYHGVPSNLATLYGGSIEWRFGQ
jgi:hypothetical protein